MLVGLLFLLLLLLRPVALVLVPFLFLRLPPAPETGAETRVRPRLPGAGPAEGGAGRAREGRSESPAADARGEAGDPLRREPERSTP